MGERNHDPQNRALTLKLAVFEADRRPCSAAGSEAPRRHVSAPSSVERVRFPRRTAAIAMRGGVRLAKAVSRPCSAAGSDSATPPCKRPVECRAYEVLSADSGYRNAGRCSPCEGGVAATLCHRTTRCARFAGPTSSVERMRFPRWTAAIAVRAGVRLAKAVSRFACHRTTRRALSLG